MLLSGKTAIITGSNRGIGKAILETFACEGADIFAHARKETPEFIKLITDLKERFNVQIFPVFFDLADTDEIKQKVKYINSLKKPVDIPGKL